MDKGAGEGENGVGEFLHPLVGVHIRHHGGPQQGQTNLVSRGADTVFPVVQHREPCPSVSQRRIAVAAHLVPVPVALPGAVGGPPEEAELGFRDGRIGVDVCREGNLQQLVPLLPVDGGDKIQPPGVAAQEDPLGHGGIVEHPLHHQRRPVWGFFDVNSGVGLQGHGQPLVHAAQLPGVVTGVDILVHEKAVARSCQVFPVFSGNPQAGQLPGGVHPADQVGIFQFVAVFLREVFHGGSILLGASVKDGAALGGDHRSPEGPGPAQVVIGSSSGGLPQQLPEQLPAFPLHLRKFRLRLGVYPGDGAAGGDVVELVEQQQLPERVQLLLPLRL